MPKVEGRRAAAATASDTAAAQRDGIPAIAGSTSYDATPTDEVYGELQRAYDFFNRELFEGRLPGVLITFTRRESVCGYFAGDRFASSNANRPANRRKADELAMNPTLFSIQPLDEILSTVAHEQCHQWQRHFGKQKSRTGYHNAEWGREMKRIGLHPSSTGEVGGAETGDHMADYIMANGLFAKKCAELIASGFRITWYDRVVPIQPVRPKLSEPVRSALAEIVNPLATGDVAGYLLVEEASGGSEISDAGAGAVVPFEQLDVTVREVSAGVVANSNRTKYSCPSGLHSVWGKPNLRLSCDDCNGKFEPVTSETGSVSREFARTRRRRKVSVQ